LVTDGLPALALGIDPADEGLMQRPPRPVGEGVLTPRMWRGIALVGVIMASGTLFVLDASLPGGFVEGSGDLRYAQTMAFTTLMLFQMFNVLNARSDERSAFVNVFTNHWVWAALGVSLLLQVVVVYTPFLQRAFGTVNLRPQDWMFCAAIASSVLWLREISKLVARWRTLSNIVQIAQTRQRCHTMSGETWQKRRILDAPPQLLVESLPDASPARFARTKGWCRGMRSTVSLKGHNRNLRTRFVSAEPPVVGMQ
jgi:magnesium-transporting ATPase (P-type)